MRQRDGQHHLNAGQPLTARACRSAALDCVPRSIRLPPFAPMQFSIPLDNYHSSSEWNRASAGGVNSGVNDNRNGILSDDATAAFVLRASLTCHGFRYVQIPPKTKTRPIDRVIALPKVGVEPTLPEENYALNVARLPIPPLRRLSALQYSGSGRLVNTLLARDSLSPRHCACYNAARFQLSREETREAAD